MATEPNVDDTLATIIGDSMKMLEKGSSPATVLNAIENRRKDLGHDASKFNHYLDLAEKFGAGMSFVLYWHYRVELEHPGGALYNEEVDKKITSTFKDGGYAPLTIDPATYKDA